MQGEQPVNGVPQMVAPQAALVAIYIPENDQRTVMAPSRNPNQLFEQERDKFNREIREIGKFGQETYNQTKKAAEEKYDALKANHPVLQRVEDQGKKLIGSAQVIQGKLRNEYEKLDQKAKAFMQQQKHAMNSWIRKKLEVIILKLLAKSKADIKEALKDPYMLKIVEELINDLIEDNWEQIEKEILFQLRMNLDVPIVHVEEPPKDPPCCLVACLQYLPVKYLNERIPYNKSVWYQLRQPWFWLFMLFEIFPFYGVQSFFYCLIFLVIDKSDEWQLVRYIVVYKKLQFCFSGILGGFIGYVQYFVCQSFGEKQSLDDFSKCRKEGPGVNVNLIADLIGLGLQVILVWIAYLLIPISQSKGKNIKFKYLQSEIKQNQNTNQDKNQQNVAQQQQTQQQQQQQQQQQPNKKQSYCCCCAVDSRKGKNLSKFMCIDLVVFIIIVGAFFGFVYGLGEKEEWQIRQILFLVKTFYCICAFPFLIFDIPFISFIITDARQTGYDKYGECVPRVVKYTLKEWEEIETKLGNKPNGNQKGSISNNGKGEDDEEKQILAGVNVNEIYA